MSSKSSKGPKRAPAAPRKIEEIRTVYDQLRAQSGDVQYQLFVLAEELKRLNSGLVSLNQEAAARNKLDSETKTEATNEQV